MSFNRHDIRRSMDVFTLDDVYLGSVLRIIPGPAIGHEEQAPPEVRQTSEINGELLGPMPTLPLGNKGPVTQSGASLYAVTMNDGERLSIGKGALVVGKWWGLVGRRVIPLDAIQTVSIERVVLRYRAAEMDG